MMNREKITSVLLTVMVSVLILATLAAAVVIWLPQDQAPEAQQTHGSEPVLTLNLKGSAEQTLEYGSSYEERGAWAYLDGEYYDAEITVSGAVDPDVLGLYTLTYTVCYEDQTVSRVRTVQVVDTRAPVIELNHIDGSYTEPGHIYQEEGFAAWDEHDGDVTALVQRIEAEDRVIYTVTDSSGNCASVERPIIYDDRTLPELKLKGDDTVTITAGSKFKEPGYLATDNVDGDISENVTVTSEVDVYLPGTYKVHYSVTDTHGNTAEATRNVVVKGLKQPDVVQPNGKVIYLTFDDGPGKYTTELLKVLETYNVKATFFVVGTMSMSRVTDIVDQGHAIGLHSNTHDFGKIYVSEEAFMDDMLELREKVYNLTGVYTNILRFPGGSSNTVSKKYCPGIMTKLTTAVTAMGFRYFDWNVDSNDAGGAKTADEVFENVISGIRGKQTAVVLQHDIKGFSVEAVERIIQWGLANGYTFLPLDESSPSCQHKVNN